MTKSCVIFMGIGPELPPGFKRSEPTESDDEYSVELPADYEKTFKGPESSQRKPLGVALPTGPMPIPLTQESDDDSDDFGPKPVDEGLKVVFLILH